MVPRAWELDSKPASHASRMFNLIFSVIILSMSKTAAREQWNANGGFEFIELNDVLSRGC